MSHFQKILKDIIQIITVGNYGSWICYICSYGGRKVSAYFVGLTICFLIKHNKNPDTDGSNSSLC